MGLLDSLAGMVSGGANAPGEAAAAPNAAPGDLVGALSGLVEQHGGLGGLVSAFQQHGLGGAVQSWIGDGQNASVSPGQVQSVLGDGPLGQFAQKLGVTPDMAAGQLSQLLPQLVDHLTPGGQVPTGEAAAGGLGGLLGGLMGRLGRTPD